MTKSMLLLSALLLLVNVSCSSQGVADSGGRCYYHSPMPIQSKMGLTYSDAR